MVISTLISLFVYAAAASIFAFVWAPLLIKTLVSLKMGKSIRLASETPVFAAMHAKKQGTPTMGGILVWVTVVVFTLVPLAFENYIPGFFSRNETLLPLGALIASAVVGLLDDYLNVRRIGAHGGGIRGRHRLLLYTLIAMVGALWFFVKLEWDIIRIPFVGIMDLGWYYVPFFVLTIVATSFSTNEADGLDGLAGGLLLAAYGAYGAIAFAQEKYDLATFCAVIAGALLAFLWYNINPARFFMGDTGAMSLGVTLGIVAMLTNYPLLLPIICFPFLLESLSVIIQLTSKKLRNGKRVFKSAPIHHHFEAIGWTEPQIVMRFWMISGVCAVLGVAIALADMLLAY